MDGALLVWTHSGNPIMDHLRGFPVVACGAPPGHERDLAYVAADDRGGARQMTRYLRERGHKVVATITGPPDTHGGVQRLAGWRDAVLRQAGRRVPEDVAVGGFDDSPVATSVQPVLTTIRQPLPRIATELVRLLRDLIDGQPPARVILPTELVRRDSA